MRDIQVSATEWCLIQRLRQLRNRLTEQEKYVILVIEIGADTVCWRVAGKKEEALG